MGRTSRESNKIYAKLSVYAGFSIIPDNLPEVIFMHFDNWR